MELRAFREESEFRYYTQEACINKIAESIKDLRCFRTIPVDQLLETADLTLSTLTALQLQCDENAKSILDLGIKDFGCAILIQRQRIDKIEKQITVNEKSSSTLPNLLDNNNHHLDVPVPTTSSVHIPRPALSSSTASESQPLLGGERTVKISYSTRIFTTGKPLTRSRWNLSSTHAWNFHPDVSEENIRSFLHRKHPNSTFSIKKA